MKILISLMFPMTQIEKNLFKVKIFYIVSIDDLYNEGDYEIAKQYAE